MERLDKFLSNAEVLSRKECKIAVKRKQITVNGVVVTDPYLKVNTAANVINAAANVATMVRYWTW